jgi:hypothetical protein
MIVVLDTHVILSALLSSHGAPAEIIRRWAADEVEVVTSPPLLTELERALAYPQVKKYLKFSPEEIETFLTRLKTVATAVEPHLTLNVVEQDPDDNRVLECALAGRAAYIVSGKRHLLELKEYQQMVILTPVEFLAALKLIG